MSSRDDLQPKQRKENYDAKVRATVRSRIRCVSDALAAIVDRQNHIGASFVVAMAEVELAIRISLLGGFAIPRVTLASDCLPAPSACPCLQVRQTAQAALQLLQHKLDFRQGNIQHGAEPNRPGAGALEKYLFLLEC